MSGGLGCIVGQRDEQGGGSLVAPRRKRDDKALIGWMTTGCMHNQSQLRPIIPQGPQVSRIWKNLRRIVELSGCRVVESVVPRAHLKSF
jgi:hypothetical protein